MFSPEISGTTYILSMSCVSGDEVQVIIHQKEDIPKWLKTLDHEGSSWDVYQHIYRDGKVIEIRKEMSDQN